MAAEDTEAMQCIEFFSGIGGLSFGLKATGRKFIIKHAVDINPLCNAVYRHLHSVVPIAKQVKDLDPSTLGADIWLISPPCQPFIRGLRINDPRDCLLDLIHFTPRAMPKYLFIENVVGFESSPTCLATKAILNDLGYGIMEFILSPLQFGIPNDRQRYYMFAAIGLPNHPLRYDWFDSPTITPLSHYLVSLPDTFVIVEIDRANYPQKISSPNDSTSCCFTKSYGRYGQGSFIRHGDKLRFFTPKEIANLHCFPAFDFPSDITLRQQWQLLGNSVNVLVVSKVLEYGFSMTNPQV